VAKIGSVILAAGMSERFVSNKLLLRIDGRPLITMALIPFLSGRIEERLVVLGRDREKMEEVLRGLPVKMLFNPSPEGGLSTSIRIALSYIDGKDGVFFHLADKPLIGSYLVERMIEVFESERPFACVPECEGVWGHPVLIDIERARSEIERLEGDRGLKEVLLNHRRELAVLRAGEECLFDVDAEKDVQLLRQRGFRVEEG